MQNACLPAGRQRAKCKIKGEEKFMDKFADILIWACILIIGILIGKNLNQRT